jgi:hypothetical protein
MRQKGGGVIIPFRVWLCKKSLFHRQLIIVFPTVYCSKYSHAVICIVMVHRRSNE